jgi:hypothetical protein
VGMVGLLYGLGAASVVWGSAREYC